MYDTHEIMPEAFLQNCVSKEKSQFNLGHVPGEIESVSSKDILHYVLVQDDNVAVGGSARRKVASQFREEEAMQHHLDQVKKGSKFEDTPPRAFLRQEVRAVVPTFYFWLSYGKL